MIKIFQEKDNDCFRACIASILECPVEKIPNFMQLGVDRFSQSWKSWEQDKPFVLIDLAIDNSFLKYAKSINLTFIGVGKSPRGNFDHCCIFSGDKMVHDPYPCGGGIKGNPKLCTMVVAKEPSIPFCPLCFSAMVKSRIECVDDSGFMFGWLCDCNGEIRKK